MNKHWKAVLGIILIFILGGLSGVVVSSIYFHHKMIEFLHHPLVTILQARENYLTKNLNLDAGQKEQIHAAFMVNLQERKDVEAEIQPQIQAMNRQTFLKIAGVLRADQRERFQQTLTAMRERALKNAADAKSSAPSPGQPVSASTNSGAGTSPK